MRQRQANIPTQHRDKKELRHSVATHLLEEGLDLFTLKEQMGHTRITTTMTYVHIAQVMPKVAFSPLDRLYHKH